LAQTVVHSNNIVNYLGDNATVISSFTLSKSKLERRNSLYVKAGKTSYSCNQVQAATQHSRQSMTFL